MARQVVRGKMVGVVDGPAILIDMNGQEKKFKLGISLTLPWIQEHMENPIMCMVEDGTVVEVM